MAIQAALTGHLVLSTLHTNDAPSAISRLQELGVAPYLIKATLLGVMAQRLVRTLCPECKTEQPGQAHNWQHFAPGWGHPPPAHTYKANGCMACRDTGYCGRSGVYEIMLMNDRLSALINPQTDINALRRDACTEGMRPLRIAAAQKVTSGMTTLEEALRVTPDL